jgi:glycogen debranching enzyme
MHTPRYHKDSLWNLAFTTIQELETETGILASGREEIYGCIFGRDSLITSLKLLRVYQRTQNEYLLTLVKKVLLNLSVLQGKEVNIESGEEPGKCIHEYRPENHEHLTRDLQPAWYLYSDGVMRIYDTVDATSLLLMTMYKYYAVSKDAAFIRQMMPTIESALDWIFEYGDANNDGFIDYQFHPKRTYGGLVVQSWMDSGESVFHEDGATPGYSIAPVEVQAYTYTALRMWGYYFATDVNDAKRAQQLNERAYELKQLFRERFVLGEGKDFSLAFAIDGAGKPMTAARSSMGHCLWAAWKEPRTGKWDSIIQIVMCNHWLSD